MVIGYFPYFSIDIQDKELHCLAGQADMLSVMLIISSCTVCIHLLSNWSLSADLVKIVVHEVLFCSQNKNKWMSKFFLFDGLYFVINSVEAFMRYFIVSYVIGG